MRTIRALAVAAALLTLPGVSSADATPATLASLTFENDFFAGYDHHYTNGVQVAFVASPRTVVAFGQRIYTPTDTDSAVTDPHDRPYAGWLYVMNDTRPSAGTTIEHLTLLLGVLCPHLLARQAQDLTQRVPGESR